MYLNHVTRDGERWDSIAWQYYGDVSQLTRLIAANPHAPAVSVLPGGLSLAIPVIPGDAAAVMEELPPWKR